MGQIGILARVADERSRLMLVRDATWCAHDAYGELVDATVATRGKTRKYGKNVECDETFWIDHWCNRCTSPG
jgi:hypothetical protein